MSITNSYPDKPIVPYKQTTCKMPDVINYIIGLPFSKEVKRATYIIFRNESANGQSGVCNNYIGMQADSGRWDAKFDSLIVGTCTKNENMTGNARRFVALRDFKASVDILADKVLARGLYVGGTTHKILKMDVKTPADLALAYHREWVTGNAKATITKDQLDNFLSMYRQACGFFL